MMKPLKANRGFVNLKDDDGEEEEALSEPAEDCYEQVRVQHQLLRHSLQWEVNLTIKYIE